MSTRRPPLRPGTPAVPGEPGLWLLILLDMTVFAVFFAAALAIRADQSEMYGAASAALHPEIGAANTVLLLTASVFVALGTRTAREGAYVVSARFLTWALACGLAFCAGKVYEWAELLDRGLTPSTNDFFSLYYMVTGMHLVHVLIGLGALCVMRAWLLRANGRETSLRLVDGGGCYWHMVDLLWLVIFPILYLLG
ncbi:cytochrome c oxidase subunit 3 [Paraconexibacter sp.]|uniref:cytochrome c oxidase subunit 3 n=1 Tax=Paraconexibacter sp. TaxID=2949640 RepID=UPI00356A380C